MGTNSPLGPGPKEKKNSTWPKPFKLCQQNSANTKGALWHTHTKRAANTRNADIRRTNILPGLWKVSTKVSERRVYKLAVFPAAAAPLRHAAGTNTLWRGLPVCLSAQMLSLGMTDCVASICVKWVMLQTACLRALHLEPNPRVNKTIWEAVRWW